MKSQRNLFALSAAISWLIFCFYMSIIEPSFEMFLGTTILGLICVHVIAWQVKVYLTERRQWTSHLTPMEGDIIYVRVSPNQDVTTLLAQARVVEYQKRARA